MDYWYNVDTKSVETDVDSSAKEHLLGPYATREEAERALDSARARTEAWDEADRRWQGDPDD